MNIEKEVEKYRSKKIGVLSGGLSREREISLRSGKNVFNVLKRLGLDCVAIDVGRDIVYRIMDEKIDLAVIMLHGKYGEDGCIQGMLEILGIPYTGPGVLQNSICMNKKITKDFFISKGIPISPFFYVNLPFNDDIINKANELGYPLIVKPISEGSSIGVKKVENDEELMNVLKNGEYGEYLVEKFIEGKEITVGSILTRDEYIELPILGLVPLNEFYDFEAKYTKGKTRMEIPARISKETEMEVRNYVKTIFYELSLFGVSRIDIILDKNEKPYFLEINTIPGMTETSDVPAMAEAMGMSQEELILYILKSAEK